MKKIKILVTGSNGQLGNEIRLLADTLTGLTFFFTDVNILDITDREDVDLFFTKHTFDFCINCAAYTAVDKAEVDKKQAYAVNTIGVKNLVQNCNKHQITLFHISTDFVFDGKATSPYKVEDVPNPINYYGETKLLGEQEITKNLSRFFIIRTSWLYGRYGGNFVKTMLKLANKYPEVKVVADQIGSPTYAKDLASFILHLIQTRNSKYGVYHFSNQGETDRYGFAKEIFRLANVNVSLLKTTTKYFSQKAKRPEYSVLDLSKTLNEIEFKIRNWKEALNDYFIE
jgi:dTDP-4-dehydrorhamnose reductase